jgi:hypothetical protein
MIKKFAAGLALSAGFLTLQTLCPHAAAAEWKVVSDKTVTGLAFPESVAYDPGERVLYSGEFGSELKPGEKDGKGRITKLSLDGKVLEKGIFPTAGNKLDKPKGMWIDGGKLWVADITSVWEFDLKSKEGRKLDLPGVTFANDVAVMGGALYVSDNRSDQVVRVEPADFLKSKDAPKITPIYGGKGINPNGIYPAKDGSLLMVGFAGKDKPRGIHSVAAAGGEPKALSKDIGMLDGLYQTQDGDIIATDWVSGTLFQWDAKGGMRTLAKDFKGPADFCVIPSETGLLMVVPDLVKGELRLVQLGR